ncbi:hypothetical protein JI435_407280, partial [Parastagonospora nodorum SN15]
YGLEFMLGYLLLPYIFSIHDCCQSMTIRLLLHIAFRLILRLHHATAAMSKRTTYTSLIIHLQKIIGRASTWSNAHMKLSIRSIESHKSEHDTRIAFSNSQRTHLMSPSLS